MNDVRPETMERITNKKLAKAFIDEQVAALRAQIGDGKVLLALSGGVDSSVVAALLIIPPIIRLVKKSKAEVEAYERRQIAR